MSFAVGDCQVDPDTYELRRNGVAVPMEPQAFDVLLYLISHRGRTVSKSELMEHVWGGRFVTESAVTSRIKQVRRAMGDDGSEQKVIRTLHGRGYRFVAAVTEAAPASVPAQPPSPPRDDLRREPAGHQVHYAESDGLQIAYQVTGSGARDIVLVAGFVSHLELDWADPRHAHFLERLGSFGRLIRFDKRGTGLSDRPEGLPDLETRIHDVLAVMDAAGSERAVLVGYSEGGPMATLFAATHPERVTSLVLYGTYATGVRSADYPWAPTRTEREARMAQLSTGWSGEAHLRTMCPSADDAMARWWGQRARAAATPSTVRRLLQMNGEVDVRDALGSVRVPTLILHRRGDRDSQLEEGRYLADRIPDARFVELPGADHFVAVEPDQILDQVEAFLDVTPPGSAARSALAAVLAVTGPGADEAVTGLVGHGGRAGCTPDQRQLVVFDGPATALRAAAEQLGRARLRDVRMGLHIAEIPLGASVLRGSGVELSVALADRAADHQLLASSAVRDLVAGTGIDMEAGEPPQVDADESPPVFALTGGGRP
jgi:pimeloyl-ACP methyl ester carboxylesterase/DNA-binding winged helix-turn-helix (wHTH) protein